MKIRSDFVSNSSSCSFFVGLHTRKDIAEFKKLIEFLKEKDVKMTLFDTLKDAHDRWYGEDFNRSHRAVSFLQPGNYILIDTGEDHYKGFDQRFWDIEDRFCSNYKFKLYHDKAAHMSSGDDLPKTDEN